MRIFIHAKQHLNTKQRFNSLMRLNRLTIRNYKKYLDDILKSEKIFPKSIRLDLDQLVQILKSERPVAKVAMHDSRYIGNILACCPFEEEIKDYGPESISHNPEMIYVCNFVIIPEFQGKGFGKAMIRGLADTAKIEGYTMLEGHFRQNASFHIIQGMGAEVKDTYPNWCGSGESYVHCILRL